MFITHGNSFAQFPLTLVGLSHIYPKYGVDKLALKNNYYKSDTNFESSISINLRGYYYLLFILKLMLSFKVITFETYSDYCFIFYSK